MKSDWETLLPLLVHIQANLDADLSLDALARTAGFSPFHLHRLFKAAIGEAPKAYTTRLRLERGAFRLLIHEASILDIALDCGYQSHETFIRAFRRRFGRAPGAYRDWVQTEAAAWHAEPRTPAATGSRYEISATKVTRMRPVHLAFIRHVGPYEAVPDSLYAELEVWASERKLPGPPIWMGIGHDAPGTTAAALLRFDAALVVRGPFAAEGRIAHQVLPGGHFAVTTHAGSFDSLPAAYATIFPRVMALPGYRLVGLPAVEIYRTARVNAQYDLNHTEICLPVVAAG